MKTTGMTKMVQTPPRILIKDGQIYILLHPQFEYKQEPTQDQSEGSRPRDGGHSQPYTGDLIC